MDAGQYDDLPDELSLSKEDALLQEGDEEVRRVMILGVGDVKEVVVDEKGVKELNC